MGKIGLVTILIIVISKSTVFFFFFFLFVVVSLSYRCFDSLCECKVLEEKPGWALIEHSSCVFSLCLQPGLTSNTSEAPLVFSLLIANPFAVQDDAAEQMSYGKVCIALRVRSAATRRRISTDIRADRRSIASSFNILRPRRNGHVLHEELQERLVRGIPAPSAQERFCVARDSH